MHLDTKNMYAYMQDFGLALLGRALVYVTFSEIARPYAHAMAVTGCAHAAEILLKARIAQEHPLLIFTKLPKPTEDIEEKLHIQKLLDEGRTLGYEDLPDMLWAVTGYRVPDLEQYRSFGRLRNSITHLGIPDRDLPETVYRYAFEVLEPMIYEFWDADIIAAYEAFDEEEQHVLEQLEHYGIAFIRRGSRR